VLKVSLYFHKLDLSIYIKKFRIQNNRVVNDGN
jgi:hypothetical protein